MIKRRFLQFLLMSIVVFGFIFVGEVEASAENWGDFDIRTEMPEDITADDVRDVYKKYGHSNSPLYDRIDWIMDEAKSYGVNPLYFIAKINWESGWGKSSYAKKHNNFGGVGGDNAITFESIEAGLTANLQLLVKYKNGEIATDVVKKGTKLTTIATILEAYCPVNDGCNHTSYINGVSSIMGWLGQPFEGDKISGVDKKEIEKKAENIKDSDGRVIPIEKLYIGREVAIGYHVGMSMGQAEMLHKSGTSWFYDFSEVVQKWMYRAGWVLSFLLFGYVSLHMLIFLVAPVRYQMSISKIDKLNEKAERAEIASMQGAKGIWEMLKQVLIALVLMCLFATGVWIQIMSLILGLVEKLIGLIF